MKLPFRRPSLRWILSWVLVLGLFLELGMRLATAWKEPKGRFMWMLGKNRLQVMGRRDGYRFFTGKKGERVEYGNLRIDFNNLGYRSTEMEILPKSEDLFRIACFGDSVTLGQNQRDYENTWPGAVEQVANDPPLSQKVEALNFGMAHYTYTTNLVNLVLLGEYLQPDIVVFLIGPNDFVCLYTRNYEADGSHDGQWLLPIADATWGFHPIGKIMMHSRIGNLLYVATAQLVVGLEATRLFNLRLSEEDLRLRLEKMGDHLGTMCTLSQALGATPVLCTYLYDEQRLIRGRGEAFLSVLDAVDDTLRAVAKEKGAVLVEANDQMKDVPAYFLDDFHLSAEGGRRFARILVKGLRDQGLLPAAADLAAPVQTESGD
jgi:lysophospholipase L1-like esterase